MDDGNKQSQSFGGGQQRPQQHPRPFFYVQPPSQPYVFYQHWQLNNPYGHYGLPTGFNFPRPCFPPYQYMQYPGFVFPHAPIYPMDHRRMFEPRLHHAPPTWSDVPPPQQQQQYPPAPAAPQQPQGRRETACSEAQTDPSDAITKLIECLDKIRSGELQGADRELDSGVASQSSGMFSPGEERREEEQGHVSLPAAPHGGDLESAATTLSDSTAAVYDGESSRRNLDSLSPQGCWSGGREEEEEEELPLDSSSVHEEAEQAATDQRFLHQEKPEVAGIQSDATAADPGFRDAEEFLALPPSSSFTSKLSMLKEAKSCGDKLSKQEENFQILKLPFDGIVAPRDAGAGHFPSPTAAPCFYSYLSTHPTHERLSVLSPSLEELSSRDEMFSTDLDDSDLFPKRVYAGRKLAGVLSGSPQAAEVDAADVWLPGSKRFLCACCGKSLAKGSGRSKVHGSKAYRDDGGGDSDEDGRSVRVVVRKHPAPRRPPSRHAAKPWYKRGQYKEHSSPAEQEGGHDLCQQDPGERELAETAGGELQCRTCQDRVCREDRTVADQGGRWGDGEGVPRRRQAAAAAVTAAASLQRQEMSGAQRKVMYHRPRDDDEDEEPPPLPWERGDASSSPAYNLHSISLTLFKPSRLDGGDDERRTQMMTTSSDQTCFCFVVIDTKCVEL
ncbi:uncharacterized protein V6R79_015454 [Siganus canaliculatus]